MDCFAVLSGCKGVTLCSYAVRIILFRRREGILFLPFAVTAAENGRARTPGHMERMTATMRVCILMGSPRLHGNTAELLKPFMARLKELGCEVDYITLQDKKILPCRGCYACQNVLDGFGCPQEDDVRGILESIVRCDCLVLATPIYTWYCPAPMKALLDRTYCMNKYYGKEKGPGFWQGKKLAVVATCGYDIEYGVSPFETGMIRFCAHSKIEYIGKIAVRDEDDLASFQTDEAAALAKDFAQRIVGVFNREAGDRSGGYNGK